MVGEAATAWILSDCGEIVCGRRWSERLLFARRREFMARGAVLARDHLPRNSRQPFFNRLGGEMNSISTEISASELSAAASTTTAHCQPTPPGSSAAHRRLVATDQIQRKSSRRLCRGSGSACRRPDRNSPDSSDTRPTQCASFFWQSPFDVASGRRGAMLFVANDAAGLVVSSLAVGDQLRFPFDRLGRRRMPLRRQINRDGVAFQPPAIVIAEEARRLITSGRIACGLSSQWKIQAALSRVPASVKRGPGRVISDFGSLPSSLALWHATQLCSSTASRP